MIKNMGFVRPCLNMCRDKESKLTWDSVLQSMVPIIRMLDGFIKQ